VRTNDPLALESRAALGLPTDRPIVMTGHHAEWWHPGLVAKYIAAAHIADRSGAAWSRILVDHKETDPCALDVPLVIDGVPRTRTVHLADPPLPGTSAMTRPTARCETHEHRDLEGIVHAMNDHADAPDLLTQWTNAMRRTLEGVVGLPDPVRATEALATPGGCRLLDAMRDDPFACVSSLNRATGCTPEARLAAMHLGVDPGAIELPLWYLRNDDTLGRLFAGDEAHVARPVAPRALTLTAIARLHLCDLFIHGDGGYVYDRATEDWMRAWRGVELAPKCAVSADMRLNFDVEQPTESDVREAEHEARDRWHAPWEEKAALVRRIEALPRKSVERRAAFADLHAFLDDLRTKHADEMDAARARAGRLRRLYEARATIESRTWPLALFDDGAQQRLRQAVRREIG
jgi:hypothetical protein